MMKRRTTEERGLIMDYKTFKSLDLEKQVELYNEWLIVNHLDEYVLYPNNDDGIELCFERAFSSMSSIIDIANELTHSTHYDTTDRLIMYDRDIPFGFKSLPDREIDLYFNQRNFLDWIDGQRLGDYDVI